MTNNEDQYNANQDTSYSHVSETEIEETNELFMPLSLGILTLFSHENNAKEEQYTRVLKAKITMTEGMNNII